MGEGKSEYGVSNLEYDLIITVGNLLEGVDAMETYAGDAEEAGDSEAAELFRMLADQNRENAQRARGVLARVLSGGAGVSG